MKGERLIVKKSLNPYSFIHSNIYYASTMGQVLNWTLGEQLGEKKKTLILLSVSFSPVGKEMD